MRLRAPLWIVVPVGLVLGAVSLPVLLPVAALLHALDQYRMRAAARRAGCARCGHPLGQAALDRADEYWAEWWRDWHRAHPHSIPRVVRTVWAVCPACGARHGFDAARRVFPLAEE